MSQSRQCKRRTSNMVVKKSPPANKKIRKPLKCKKNVIHTSESRKNSLKKCKSAEKKLNCEVNEKSFLRSSPKSLRSSPRLALLPQPENISISEKNILKPLNSKFKMLDSIEIDGLSNFTKSNKKTSSSSRQSNEFQTPGLLIANENISKLKSQKYKKNLDKLSADISLFIQNRSCKDKRQSFYKESNLNIYQCENPKSKMPLNDMDSKMTTPRTSELPKDSLRLSNSRVLRSADKHKRTSNDILLSNELTIKETRNSITTPKNQQTENTKEIQSLSSELKKGFVQKNKGRNSDLRHTKKPETDINYKAPKAVEELFTNRGSSRNSMTLRTRHSSGKTVQENEKIDSEKEKIVTRSSRSSSEKPSKNRISLRTRHHSEKTSNNMLSDEMLHSANREKNKKYTVISKERKKENVKNVKTTSKSTSSANQEAEILVHNNNENDSTTKRSLKSKTDKCFNDKDPQTPKMIPPKTPQNATSSQRKSSRLLSRRNSEKTPNSDSRVRECSVGLTDVMEERPTRKSALSSKSAVVEGRKSARRLPSSPLETKTPIQKKRKLSVKFKKQSRPRSFSAVIPIDDLALMTPTMARKTKSDIFPGRNSLKRKRFVMDEIKKADDGYEDDIYESKTFDHFKDMFPDSSDSSELSCPIKTPKLASLLTPGIHCKTPAYFDCFSPTEYAVNRKIAEEYIYRNRKKKRTSQVETPVVPEKKKLEFNKVVEKACATQKEVEKLTADSSDEEDLYFNEDF